MSFPFIGTKDHVNEGSFSGHLRSLSGDLLLDRSCLCRWGWEWGERGLMENALESFQVDRWADGERSGEVFR